MTALRVRVSDVFRARVQGARPGDEPGLERVRSTRARYHSPMSVNFADAKVLVTGGAGFLGSSVAPRSDGPWRDGHRRRSQP